jgi:hypothetical protein
MWGGTQEGLVFFRLFVDRPVITFYQGGVFHTDLEHAPVELEQRGRVLYLVLNINARGVVRVDR